MTTTAKIIGLLAVCCLWLFSTELRSLTQITQAAMNWQSPSNGVVKGGSSQYLRIEPPLRLDVTYKPASSEEYAMTHAQELGYLATTREELTIPSCKIFTDPTIPVYMDLQYYRDDLKEYNRRVAEFQTDIKDLRTILRQGTMSREELCSTLDVGIADAFAQSQQVSYGSFGYAEPLIPPLRHPEFCFSRGHLMTMTYMIHDWKVMCERLTPFSRTVFIDMGASLSFHSEGVTPAVYILKTYQKFGFQFDHVYAFEITQQAPAQVFQLVPDELFPNYHWINVGVESDPNGKLNPLRMLLDKYTEEDFVVIKLDIDTGSIEVPLAYQLLNDDRYSRLVDQLYFEHHVHQLELARSWGPSMEGSLKASLDLFRGLREKGIAAHYWV